MFNIQMHSEYPITLTISILSLMVTAITMVIAMYIILHFAPCSNPKQSTRDTSTPPTGSDIIVQRSQQTAQVPQPTISKTLRISASVVVVFNALNALFNSFYCLYLIWDPMSDDQTFYIYHPSHIQRIASTCSWYIAKVALTWFVTCRLECSFKDSFLEVNKKAVIIANILNTIIAPITLTIAYWAVYTHRLVLAELLFNTWRIVFQITMLIILYMFSKRLLLLTIQQHIDSIVVYDEERVASRNRAASAPGSDPRMRVTQSPSFTQRQQQNVVFMHVVTRNAVLVFTLSITVALVMFCFFGFRFIFGVQTRLTLLIPMNMAAIDSLITSICIFCMFRIGDRLYKVLCGNCCDSKCNRICGYFSARLLLRRSSVVSNIASSSASVLERQNMQHDSIEIAAQFKANNGAKSLTLKPKLSLRKSNQKSVNNKEYCEILIDGTKKTVEEITTTALVLNASHSEPVRSPTIDDEGNTMDKPQLHQAKSLIKLT
eukprot:62318_1